MKYLFVLALSLPSLAHAGCDLALLEMRNDVAPNTYDAGVLADFAGRGYRAHLAAPFAEAGLSSYVAEVGAICGPYLMNPFVYSTITTLKVTDARTGAVVAEIDSPAQLKLGACKMDLASLVAKLPACQN